MAEEAKASSRGDPQDSASSRVAGESAATKDSVTYLERLRAHALDNLQIEITNVHVRLEDSYEALSDSHWTGRSKQLLKTCIGVAVKNISLKTREYLEEQPPAAGDGASDEDDQE